MGSSKELPFTKGKLDGITEKFDTPFYIYDEKGIRENARRLNRAFSWCKGFKNYYAVKACPNPYIMKILKSEGFGADCSSLPELLLAEKTGLSGEEIMFTSNDTPAEEFRQAIKQGAVVNLDDITHLPFLEESAGIPELICFRFNPGKEKAGNLIIGHPEEAKYGATRQQLVKVYSEAAQKGAKRFGIHTMVASNELDEDYFVETARLLFELVAEISEKAGISFEFVNLGGGIGIPYKPEEDPVDIEKISDGVKKLYNEIITGRGYEDIKIYLECGRMVTGPYGYLVTRVRHRKHTYKDFIGVDACMADLMRPAIYGAYHHITVPGKNTDKPVRYDVTGSLCENNDKFAIDRMLPELHRGDLVVIHDTGAHGHAMGFNYNGKLRHAELLLRENGDAVQIRRPESVEDYFATLDFSGLEKFDV